jgi:hypothetical protein
MFAPLPKPFAKASGFTLVEVGLASVLMAALVSGFLLLAADELRLSAAQSSGMALSSLNTAVNQYEAKFSTNLANHTAIPIPGFANVVNPYAPTTVELFELGFLKTSVPTGVYGIAVNPTVTAGTPSGLVWVLQPFTNYAGKPSQDLAGAAMLSAGGDAAISTIANPGIIEGADGWTATNPQTGTAAIVAMRNGAGSAAYVRLDGSTPMQGSLSFNNFNLSSVNSLSAANASVAGGLTAGSVASSGNVTAGGSVTGNAVAATGGVSGSSLSASALNTNSVFFGSSALYSDGWNSVIRNTNGALYVENFGGGLEPTVTSQLVTPGGNGVQIGSTYYYGDSQNSAIRQDGTLFVQNNAGSAPGNLDAGHITAEGYMQVNGFAAAGSGCSPNGLIGQNGAGSPLFCVNGIWKSVGGPNYTWATAQNTGKVSNLSAVAVCPAGTQMVAGGGVCDAGFATYLRYSLPMPSSNAWEAICDDYNDRSPGTTTAWVECAF